MTLRLSQIKDSSEIVDSTITIKLSDYGTISDLGTHQSAVNNADIFKIAYQDILSKRFGMFNAAVCYLECPPGDYYFGDNPSGDSNYYTMMLNHPQAANISIRGITSGTKPSNSALSSASTVNDRYNLLKAYYKTRFHFKRNGILGGLSNTTGARAPGLHKIGVFGSYKDAPGSFDTTYTGFARGITGSIRLEYCCVHGFGINGNGNSWGLGTDGGGKIDTYDIQVVDCARGFFAQRNGTINSFGDACSIHNIAGTSGQGLLAMDSASIYFAGGGTGYVANCSNTGVIAYSGGIIRFGNGGTHTVTSTVKENLYADTLGLIVGDATTVSYSTKFSQRGARIEV
jgi:hypothetical protein